MLVIPSVGSGTYSPGPNHMVVPPHSSSLSSQKRLEPQYKRDRPTRLHRSQNPRYSLLFSTNRSNTSPSIAASLMAKLKKAYRTQYRPTFTPLVSGLVEILG